MGTELKAQMAARIVHHGYRFISSGTKNGPSLFTTENQMLFQERVKRLKNSSKNQALSVKNASVLVPLVLVDNDPCLLFTQRSLALNAHAGEVCYPGGKFDARFDNNLIDTAFRETEEELGINRNSFEVWETLPPLKARDGKSMIKPIVALLKDPFNASDLKLNQDEVSEVFTCTISEMCKAENQGYTQF